jgi:hypothetical protein
MKLRCEITKIIGQYTETMLYIYIYIYIFFFFCIPYAFAYCGLVVPNLALRSADSKLHILFHNIRHS